MIIWVCRFVIVLGFGWVLRLALITAELPSSHDPSYYPDRWPWIGPTLAVATIGSLGALALTRVAGRGAQGAIVSTGVMIAALGGHFVLTLWLSLMTIG